MDKERHEATLHYYNTDDGVWLECSCGWTHCLGFGQPLEAANEAFHAHELAMIDRQIERR